MKLPFFLIVIGRICRHAPQAAVWFVVGMVCFHSVLRVMGVSWYDILWFWAYMISSFVGATMAEKYRTKRDRERQTREDEEDRLWLENTERIENGRNLDT